MPKAFMLTALAALLATAAAQEVGCLDQLRIFSLPELRDLAAYKTAFCGSSCAEYVAAAGMPAARLEQYYCVCSSPAITYQDSMVGCELYPSPPPPPTQPTPLSPPPLPPTAPPPAVCEGALGATPYESAAWKTIFCGSDCDSLRASVAEVYMPSPYYGAYGIYTYDVAEGALWVEQMQCQCANPDVPWMETVVCYPPVSDLLSEPVSNLKSMLPVSDLKQAAFSRAGVGVLGAAFVASIAIAAVVARRVRNASVAPPSLI